VRDADDADDLGVVTERVGGGGIQGDGDVASAAMSGHADRSLAALHYT
jgi:hypothetical protein